MNSAPIILSFLIGISSFSFAETASPEEEKAIRGLIEELVYNLEVSSDSAAHTEGQNTRALDETKKCISAFRKLMELKGKAIPFLVEHLEDKRSSVHFRNHFMGHSVGNACHWNLYFQLQDRPENYSSYGHQRTGRDGERHTQPYWAGTPFDGAGGIPEWLKLNAKLSYPEKQIKCLNWLLEAEKKIGVPDTDSYFVNILPLEIQILKRKIESGEDLKAELEKLETALKNSDASIVPKELLPSLKK